MVTLTRRRLPAGYYSHWLNSPLNGSRTCPSPDVVETTARSRQYIKVMFTAAGGHPDVRNAAGRGLLTDMWWVHVTYRDSCTSDRGYRGCGEGKEKGYRCCEEEGVAAVILVILVIIINSIAAKIGERLRDFHVLTVHRD